jgi:hypothetical protein
MHKRSSQARTASKNCNRGMDVVTGWWRLASRQAATVAGIDSRGRGTARSSQPSQNGSGVAVSHLSAEKRGAEGGAPSAIRYTNSELALICSELFCNEPLFSEPLFSEPSCNEPSCNELFCDEPLSNFRLRTLVLTARTIDCEALISDSARPNLKLETRNGLSVPTSHFDRRPLESRLSTRQ